jgi:hypothetical protein
MSWSLLLLTGSWKQHRTPLFICLQSLPTDTHLYTMVVFQKHKQDHQILLSNKSNNKSVFNILSFTFLLPFLYLS